MLKRLIIGLCLAASSSAFAGELEPSAKPFLPMLRAACSWIGPSFVGVLLMLDEIEDVGSRMVTVYSVLGDPSEITGVGSRLVTTYSSLGDPNEITSVGSRLVTVDKEPASPSAIEFVGSRLLTVQYDPYRNEDVGTRMFSVDGTMALTILVSFEDLISPNFAPTHVDVDLLQNTAGDAVIASFPVTLVNGSVTITSPTRQLLYVRVRQNMTWLGMKKVVDLRATPQTANFSLSNGDCDANNIVDLTDYTRVVLAFNAQPGDANWDVSADLNRDQIVDLTDYTIIVLNFNRVGD